ncbi:MAG: hypothetical protein ACK515_07565, partial [bacterium]
MLQPRHFAGQPAAYLSFQAGPPTAGYRVSLSLRLAAFAPQQACSDGRETGMAQTVAMIGLGIMGS